MTKTEVTNPTDEVDGRSTADLIEMIDARLKLEARERLAAGAGDRRFSARLVEASRPTATQAESRLKLRELLGTFWDDAEACGARHVVAMLGAAIGHETSRWHREPDGP
jgi:hypothetical protein